MITVIDTNGNIKTSATASIGTNTVTNANLRQSVALSVIGNSTNATANVADISAASDGDVLRRSGTALGFGGLAAAAMPALTGVVTTSAGAVATSFASNPTLPGVTRMDAHYGAITADTDGATITFNLDTTDKHTVTLGGNRTIALSNGHDGQVFMIILVQDGTGTRTVTWFSGIKWASGTTPTLTTTINKADVFSFIRTASGAYYGFVVGQNL